MSETMINGLIGLATVIMSGAVAAWITARSGKKKNDADAAKAITESVEKLLSPLNKRVDEVQGDLQKVEGELRWYKFGVSRLITQLQRQGINPDWTPEMDRKVMREAHQISGG